MTADITTLPDAVEVRCQATADILKSLKPKLEEALQACKDESGNISDTDNLTKMLEGLVAADIVVGMLASRSQGPPEIVDKEAIAKRGS